MSYGKGVGYSDKINRPELQKLKPHGLTFIPKLSLCLAPLAIVVFLVLALLAKVAWSVALISGGLCGLLCVGIYYVTSKNTGEVKAVDGVLQAKKRLRKKGSVSDKDIIFLLIFKLKDNTERKVNITERKALFKYYQEGDIVRFHPGLPYPEKYEKLFDDKVVCVSCGKLTDTTMDRCRNCHLPLLK